MKNLTYEMAEEILLISQETLDALTDCPSSYGLLDTCQASCVICWQEAVRKVGE